MSHLKLAADDSPPPETRTVVRFELARGWSYIEHDIVKLLSLDIDLHLSAAHVQRHADLSDRPLREPQAAVCARLRR